jgi:hypothetical protein
VLGESDGAWSFFLRMLNSRAWLTHCQFMAAKLELSKDKAGSSDSTSRPPTARSSPPVTAAGPRPVPRRGIDDLNEISVKQSENREDEITRAKSGVFGAVNMRREALIAMLDSLIPEVAGKVTSCEYASVAYALERYGDLDMADKYWQLAVNIAHPHSTT